MKTTGTRWQQGLERVRSRLRGDEGWAGTALMYLGVLFMLFTGFQVAFWFNGYTVSQGAAQAGYTVARSYESTAEAGRASAMQFLERLDGAVTNPTVTVTRTPDQVAITVTGTITVIVPGLEGVLPQVSYTLTGPVERWVPAP